MRSILNKYPQALIVAILIVAFIIRLTGIGFGLPLWLVGDEPTLIFGALKMLELKTIIPAAHREVFALTFYYTPFISYLYLFPFLAYIGISFFIKGVDVNTLSLLMRSDPSAFFLMARFLAVLVGTGTVYLSYALGLRLFKNKTMALYAAGFLALSFLHSNFSHWARHWIYAAFLLSALMLVLLHEEWPSAKRYFVSAILSGMGVGIAPQMGLTALFIVLWYLIYDRRSLFKDVKTLWFWGSIAVFVCLVLLVYVLWPQPFFVARNAPDSIFYHKTLSGLFHDYWMYIRSVIKGDPLLSVFAFFGALAGFQKYKRLFFVGIIFLASYVAIFYYSFLNMDRYILPFYPLFALCAGFGLWCISQRLRRRFQFFLVFSLIALMIAPLLYLDLLFLRNDSRIQALDWIYREVSGGSKIAVLAPLTRLPGLPSAVMELESIQPQALRNADKAEKQLTMTQQNRKAFHALNLEAVSDSSFFAHLSDYLETQGYEYIVFNPEFLLSKKADSSFLASGAELEYIHGDETPEGLPFTDGFNGGLPNLLRTRQLGPEIIIRRLN
ncbi:MAG: hypothetical protein HYY51_01010 [Candidatus Magasanikbacteria bacterium]|nr:hypothetical protein [Candidatus Magasanikbacteria bacterium]